MLTAGGGPCEKTGFSHKTKMVPAKSQNDISRRLVGNRVEQEPFCSVRTHFYNDASTNDRFCDAEL